VRINRQAGNGHSSINARLGALDGKLAGFEAWFAALNGKLDSVHATMVDKLESSHTLESFTACSSDPLVASLSDIMYFLKIRNKWSVE
jgi:hypothetical protein